MFNEVDGCPECDGLDHEDCQCGICGDCTTITDVCEYCGVTYHACSVEHECEAKNDAELIAEVMSYSFDDSEESQYGVGGVRDR